MVEILEQTTDSCVVVRFSDKVSGKEYQSFLEVVDSRLRDHEKINLVVDLPEFTFYGDFEAFKEDWHFGTHEYHQIRRVAFIGDQKWIDVFVKLVEPFSRAEDKRFPSGQIEVACTWACSGEK
jgi:SpoIIAA-like